jgi:hypothetical protein
MKSLLGKLCYKAARLAWRMGLKETSYTLAMWGFKLTYKPKTYSK